MVLAGATIGEDASVTGSTVMGTVGAGARLTGCVIGADAVVEPGEVLTAVRRPDPDAV